MSNSELSLSSEKVNLISHEQCSKLYPVLTCPRDKFDEMYNYDVSELVESNTFKEKSQKGGGSILYLSYSHAVRIFRQSFSDLGIEFACAENPKTGGYVFEELNSTGYFIKSFIHDGYRRSEMYYYGILNSANQTTFPDDVDKNDKPVGNAQLFNKSYYRAIVKAIALWSGLGLKLWTGEDLSSEMIDELTVTKEKMITGIKKLAIEFKLKFGQEYDLPELSYILTVPQLKEIGLNIKKSLQEPVTVVDVKSVEVTDSAVSANRTKTASVKSENETDSTKVKSTEQEIEELV